MRINLPCVFFLRLLAGLFHDEAFAQCDDWADDVLCAYALSDTEAAQFSMNDGRMSAFWDDWAGRDMVVMYPPDNCYPGRCLFTNDLDAGLVVKAAVTRQGLYLCLAVTDDVFIDRTSADDWGADCIDLYLDVLSSEEIWTCTGCLIGLYDSRLTYNTEQYQTWVGSDAVLPVGSRFMKYDLTYWGGLQPIGLTWEQLRLLYQVEAEPVRIDAHQKALEMRFAWQLLFAWRFNISY